MQRVEHDLSEDQWLALQDAWGCCAYCGAVDRPPTRDCLIAISRVGRYTLDNIAPACGSCNASKCNEEVTGWLRRKRYDERAFLARHLEIQSLLASQSAGGLSRSATSGTDAPDDTPVRACGTSSNAGCG
jgi:hypothetical protein